jgi:hypothetical protein
LDWIVLKCLEKDRTRRYATANGLAVDVERYLQDEPVLARPPSQWYRLEKLVRRNRMAFLFGAAAATALLLGTIVSTLLFISEARLRREAEVRERASHVAQLVTQRRFEEADKFFPSLPLDRPSIEVAAEMRALGDWHATHFRWPQAAEHFSATLKVDRLDEPAVSSLDQLRLAAALLEAGDRRGYEQLCQRNVTRFASGAPSLPAAMIKACLLLPAGPEMLPWLAKRSDADASSNPSPAAIRSTAWPDVKMLLNYRRGDLAEVAKEQFLCGNPATLATFSLIHSMASWQKKDYWGAMVTWTRSYALVQAAARQGLVPQTVRPDILPGLSEPDILQAAWYDWAVADLLLRELDRKIGEAEQSLNGLEAPAPGLEAVAIARAAGEWHMLRGEWVQALACVEYCRQSNQQDSLDHATMDYLNGAIACLELGDEKAYVQLREEMATRFQGAGELVRTLEVGLLRPIDERVAATVESYAAGLAHLSRANTNDYWGLMLVSLHAYRQGHCDVAIDLARQSLARVRDGTLLPSAELSIILALSLNQLGNRAAASAELDRAESVIRTGFNLEYDLWHWRHWLIVRLLLQEAKGLILK